MLPRLVPEILPLDAFCDVVGVVVVVGIGDSRSWIMYGKSPSRLPKPAEPRLSKNLKVSVTDNSESPTKRTVSGTRLVKERS